MLTALAPTGPVAPPVPNSPPSTTDSTQPAGRESFKDVYGNISARNDSKGDAGPKQKTGNSGEAKAKKSSEAENDKTAVTAAPQQGIVVQKAPLAFVIPALGQESFAEPDSCTATEEQPQATEQVKSEATAAAATTLPDFNLPVTKSDPAVAPTGLIPANEKLAFSARLTPPEAPATLRVQPPPLSALQPSRLQPTNDSRAIAEEFPARDLHQSIDSKAVPNPVLPAREAAAASVIDLRPATLPAQSSEFVHATPVRSLAIQDVQPIVPDIPRAPASTEILLHLAGQNQSAASVRLVERSGTVNVTVHAADADLRNSLRSNLSDLASQLSGQGFKTEVVRPTVLAANADNQQDTRQSGQDSPAQQHHSAQDGRQSPRERRANPERWLDEFVQEASRTPVTPGGKN